uniref:Uncharacterized protein n=1 Tax=Gokushovirinae environmental samples TaxID=1478972 RepID=A0A2R3UAM5_9VIRU|nr:hypothetical protein [Gokushovirinae environmental samples]
MEMRHSQNKRHGAKQFRRNASRTKAINIKGGTRGGHRL